MAAAALGPSRRRSPACSWGAGPRPCCPGRPGPGAGPAARAAAVRARGRGHGRGQPGDGRPGHGRGAGRGRGDPGLDGRPELRRPGPGRPRPGPRRRQGGGRGGGPAGGRGAGRQPRPHLRRAGRGRRLLVGHPGGGGRPRPEHLSAYALTIEPATKFGRLVAAGRMAEPAEDDLADRYEAACATLAAAGYAHYEVSNWARGGSTPAATTAPTGGGAATWAWAGRTSSTAPSGAGTSTGCRPTSTGPRAAAARRRGGAPRPRPGAVRGAGPAAAGGRRARPGRGPWPGRRSGWAASQELRRAGLLAPDRAAADREGHVPARRGRRPPCSGSRLP